MLTWRILIPVRGGSASKSRLANAISAHEDRKELALAFASDVVAAASAAPSVEGVSIITADDSLSDHFTRVGAEVIIEPERLSGLNAAVRFGTEDLQSRYPKVGIAVIMGDLPEVTPEAIAEALELASAVELGVVADHERVGTSMLTARPGSVPHPSYGEGSYARHIDAGHVDLPIPGDSPLRRDVDTATDLRRLRKIPAEKHTLEALRRVRPRD